MTVPPIDPKAAMEEIVKRREAELEAQKEKEVTDAASAQTSQTIAQQTYLTGERDARARVEEREEWRQEQHAKHREEEGARRKQEVERLVEVERKKKLAEEQVKRDEQMAILHKKAIEKKSAEKIAGAKVEENKRKRDATNYEDRALAGLDADVGRRITHLKSESDKRKRTMQAGADRTHTEADEAVRAAKLAAQKQATGALRDATTDQERRGVRTEESQRMSQATAEHRRAIFALDESLAKKLFDIDIETKRLVDEVTHDFQVKKQIAARDADRKRIDAQAQRERAEDVFGIKEPKKDSKDPLS